MDKWIDEQMSSHLHDNVHLCSEQYFLLHVSFFLFSREMMAYLYQDVGIK